MRWAYGWLGRLDRDGGPRRYGACLGPLIVGAMVEKIEGERWWCRTGRNCLYVWFDLGRVHFTASTLPVWGWHWWALGLSLPDRVPSHCFAGRFFNLTVKLKGAK